MRSIPSGKGRGLGLCPPDAPFTVLPHGHSSGAPLPRFGLHLEPQISITFGRLNKSPNKPAESAGRGF